MKKTIIIAISIILLLGVGFMYLVKNPESSIAQKVLPIVGIETTQKNDLQNRMMRNRPDGAPVGMANPASRNCERKGGKLEIVEGTGGQVGMCTLADGTSCEERAYMRGECGMGHRGLPVRPSNVGSGTACTMEYLPVCASVQVQCIKAPCPPIEQTFGNKCMMETNAGATFLYDGVCTTK